MANVNRWHSGRKNPITVKFSSGTTVEMGDLIFFDNEDNLRNNGSSTASHTGYPISWLRKSGASLEINKAAVPSRFLGVALSDKDGGLDKPAENIAVAREGVFEFDLSPATTVDVGKIAGVSGTSSASDMFDQKVMLTTQTAKAIGYFAERKVHAKTAQVIIHSTYGLGVIS